jgi:hypothetical protein
MEVDFGKGRTGEGSYLLFADEGYREPSSDPRFVCGLSQGDICLYLGFER